MAQAIGIDETVNECDCCGKVDLKLTVVMRLDDGQVVHYGTTCAARNTDKTQKQIRVEMADHAAAMQAQAQAEFKVTPQAAAERQAFETRPAGLHGPVAAEWIRPAQQAADAARKAIAAKYGIPDRWLSLHR